MGPWRLHTLPTLVLALPLIGSHLARTAMGVIDTLMVGRYAVEALAAVVLATSVFLILFMAGGGYAIGLMARVASALARGDDTDVRRATRMALWLSILHSALMAPLMWASGPILSALGQEPVIAALAQEWLRVMAFAMPTVLAGMTLNSYLAALGRANVVMWITLAGLPANAVLNWLLIFGPGPFPEWGVFGAALASAAINWVQLAALALCAAWLPVARRFELFARFWKPDWAAFRDILLLGLPIGLTTVAEIGMFTGSNLMMGLFGTDALAAHGIALQISSLTFMVHLGISNAATIRAGTARGHGDPAGLRGAALAAILLSGVFAVLTMAMFLAIPKTLAGLYLSTSDPRTPVIVGLAAVLMIYAAAFQVVDALQAVALGLLRGVQDTRVPMVLAVISYWLIGLPAAWLLAFPLGMGPPGLWAGLVVGLTAAAGLLLRRFWGRSDNWVEAPARNPA
ncbi:MATE family efflux transporter [Paracoccus sp. Z118]|uniref:MATE family efflux transporter n=1 Tax=Paracoccus sp. Z118 TaxID=2851017 RepID=UPI001C2C164C|nr:MATE family efflux transporter [Paracoccus sp. Z118]MBV0892457.1 MATE family efflux transporter [Paracoccus sp. Z118]